MFLHQTKAERQTRMRQKPGTKRKQQIKTRRKEEKKETEQENVKEGGGKGGGRSGERKGDTQSYTKMPIFTGKKLCVKSKEKKGPPPKKPKGKNKPKNETKTNKKGLMKQNFVIEYFDVVVFMKPKQRRNKNKLKNLSQFAHHNFLKNNPLLTQNCFLNLRFSERKHWTLSHFAKCRWFKENRYVPTPVLDQKLVFLPCILSEEKHWCCKKQQNFKSGKKTKIRTRVLKEKRRQETRKKGLMREKHCNWIVRCCSFHERKAKKEQKEIKRKKRRVKGHLTWPLNPPQKTKKMVSCCPKMAVWKRIGFFSNKKCWNLFLIIARYLGTKKHKMITECAQGPRQNTPRFWWFCLLFPKTEKTDSMPKKGVPWKRPFFCPAQSYQKAFSEQTQFQRKSAFWEATSTKNPTLTEEFWKGLEKSKKKTEKNDTSRLVQTALLLLFFGKAPFWARKRKAATKHDENRYFWRIKTPGPIIERTAAPLSNPWIQKSGPIIEAYSIYIYIYITYRNIEVDWQPGSVT